jgi:hypothetical protein
MPLGEGLAHKDPTLIEIAKKHGVTPAQVTFAWLLSREIVVLSASTNSEHQQLGRAEGQAGCRRYRENPCARRRPAPRQAAFRAEVVR